MTDSPTIPEADLATTWRVPRQRLREIRKKLAAGEALTTPEGVLWLPAAALRVAQELGLAWTPGAVAEPEPGEVLTVVRPAANPNIVMCRRKNGEEVAVRVVTNTKYVPKLTNGTPMTLRAQKSPAGNWWVLMGREPRWRGVW